MGKGERGLVMSVHPEGATLNSGPGRAFCETCLIMPEVSVP